MLSSYFCFKILLHFTPSSLEYNVSFCIPSLNGANHQLRIHRVVTQRFLSYTSSSVIYIRCALSLNFKDDNLKTSSKYSTKSFQRFDRNVDTE